MAGEKGLYPQTPLFRIALGAPLGARDKKEGKGGGRKKGGEDTTALGAEFSDGGGEKTMV